MVGGSGLCECVGHHVGPHERSWLEAPASFERDERGIQDSVTRDISTAKLLWDEHGEPAELGSPPAVGESELRVSVGARAHLGQRAQLVHKTARRLHDQFLVV